MTIKIRPIPKPRCECLNIGDARPECREDADYVVTYDDGSVILMCDHHASARFGTTAVLFGEVE